MAFDGYGIYDNIAPSGGSASWGSRLTQIASGGFSLVLNYDICDGHIADILSYINTAVSLGLRVIVALHDPAIWRDATYSTKYPLLYADAGNPATGIAFMQYLVGQVKSIKGVWGYYVFDEIANSDHTTLKAYTDAVKTADAAHPRLGIISGTGGSSCWQSLSTLYDCADVMGDDWYTQNYTAANNLGWTSATTNVTAAGDQIYANLHGIQSAMALQAFNANEYSSQICTPWPSCATFPTQATMRQCNTLCRANMTPRVVMWYSYQDILRSDNPTLHWQDLVETIGTPMAQGLLQSATAASSAASPTSITPTLAAASTAGNLLIIAVAVTGTSPTITTPTNWASLGANSQAGLAFVLYRYENNPGGITSVVITVGGTGGGAVAAIFEFQGMTPYKFDTNATQASAGSTSYANKALAVTTRYNDLLFYATAFAAATLTPSNTNEWSPVIAAISTNGTPNAQLGCFWGLSVLNSTETMSGTFNASVVNAQTIARYIVAGSQQETYNNVGGMSGQLVGQFFQGMIGG